MVKDNQQSLLSREEILVIVRKTLGKENDVELKNYAIKPASDNPVGFNGEHKRIEADVVIKNENKRLIYFVKHVPSSVKAFKDYIERNGSFYKEIGVYKDYFQDVKNFCKPLEVKKWHPECYFTRGKELIVFEDLCLSGYYMWPERTLLDEEHIYVSLDSIASMHASSIIFEEELNKGKIHTQSEKYIPNASKKATFSDAYSHLLFETEACEDPSHPGHTVYEVNIQGQMSVIDLMTQYTPEQKEKIKQKLPDVMRKIYQLVKPSDKYKNVIIHGDLWTNNLLFRKSETGKVENAVIVDFALTRAAPPAHDVIMFLHLVQTCEFRNKHRPALLDYYYKRLSLELVNFGVNVDDHLTKDEFLESCDHYELLGLVTALFYFQWILVPSEFTNKYMSTPELYKQAMFVGHEELSRECFLNDEIYATRIGDTLGELVERYIF